MPTVIQTPCQARGGMEVFLEETVLYVGDLGASNKS